MIKRFKAKFICSGTNTSTLDSINYYLQMLDKDINIPLESQNTAIDCGWLPYITRYLSGTENMEEPKIYYYRSTRTKPTELNVIYYALEKHGEINYFNELANRLNIDVSIYKLRG